MVYPVVIELFVVILIICFVCSGLYFADPLRFIPTLDLGLDFKSFQIAVSLWVSFFLSVFLDDCIRIRVLHTMTEQN